MKAGFDSPSGYKFNEVKNTNMANKYSENWKESWNEEEWQGRSQNKIQGAYKIAFVSLIVIFVVSLLYYVLN